MPNNKTQKTNPHLQFQTPASYKFGFDVTDDQNTNYQNRQEQRDGNKISGSYSVVDSDGFIRTVTYTADPKEGFKAEVIALHYLTKLIISDSALAKNYDVLNSVDDGTLISGGFFHEIVG